MNIWQDFLNTNFFTGISTIVTVVGAIVVYKFQKSSEKQQIARLLVNEIRNAENGIQNLTDHANDLEYPVISILPKNSWSDYSHFFAKDLNQDDYVQMNNFFTIASVLEYVVRKGNKIDRFLLQAEQRSAATLNAIYNLVAGSPDKESEKTNFKKFESYLDEGIGNYHYAPQGFHSHLTELLKNYSPILETHAGTVLKKVAKLQV